MGEDFFVEVDELDGDVMPGPLLDGCGYLGANIFPIFDITDGFAERFGAADDVAGLEVLAELAILGLFEEAVEGGDYGEAAAGHGFHGCEGKALAVGPHDEDVGGVFEGGEFLVIHIAQAGDLLSEPGMGSDEVVDFLILGAVAGDVEVGLREVGDYFVIGFQDAEWVFAFVDATTPEEGGVALEVGLSAAFGAVEFSEAFVVAFWDDDVFGFIEVEAEAVLFFVEAGEVDASGGVVVGVLENFADPGFPGKVGAVMVVDVGDVVFDEMLGCEVEGVGVAVHLPVDDVGLPIEDLVEPGAGPLFALIPPTTIHGGAGFGGEPFDAVGGDVGVVGVHDVAGNRGGTVGMTVG